MRRSIQSTLYRTAASFVTGGREAYLSMPGSVLSYRTVQMPPDPSLFTSGDVDSKTLRRRTQIWVEKTFYVLHQLNRGGYSRGSKPESIEMVEKMAERISGLTVAYRHLLDEHLLSAYIYHLAKLSDCLIEPGHLLTSHGLLLSDLYSRAALCVDRMTPLNVAQILVSYDVFRDAAKSIRFKNDSAKYGSEMDHVRFVRALLQRFDEVVGAARTTQLLEAVTSVYTIDPALNDIADRILAQLHTVFRLHVADLDTVAEYIYALGVWGVGEDTQRGERLEELLARVELATDSEIKAMRATAFGKLLYGLGRLRCTSASDVVFRTQLWLDERFNGYAMQPRDLARAAYGYAFTNSYDGDLKYLLTRQAVRRAGLFRGWNLQILKAAFDEMDIPMDDEMAQQLVEGDVEYFERIYGRR